jgi:hypothetical protein
MRCRSWRPPPDPVITGEHLFTLASDWCPNPQWWTGRDNQSAEVEVSDLVAAFVRAVQPNYVIETGSAHGHTARAIGVALGQNGHGRLDTLEVDPELAQESRRRCANLPVTVHDLSSLDFTPAEQVGFAWFDSLIELRIPEFDRFRPWMRPGTIVGFHDTAPHHGKWGQQIADHPGLRSIFLRTPRGVCFAEVL